MRISDWSSDVCSSDLITDIEEQEDEHRGHAAVPFPIGAPGRAPPKRAGNEADRGEQGSRKRDRARRHKSEGMPPNDQTGRATCRERVCQYGYISVVSVYMKKKIKKITDYERKE